MVLKRNLIYDLLADIYYRLTISFGYFQCAIRDMDREGRRHSTHSPDWELIESVMNQHKTPLFFLWENVVRSGKPMTVPRRWPKWYNDFWVPYYTGEL